MLVVGLLVGDQCAVAGNRALNEGSRIFHNQGEGPSPQRTVSAHCELALCAEFIVQWLARWAGYSETRVRFPVNTPPTFPHLYVVASVW